MASVPYRDPARPIAERVDDLLARMTLDEKLAQLGCVWSTQLVARRPLLDARRGPRAARATASATSPASAAPPGSARARAPTFANAIQRFLVEETRLGIPAIVHEESVRRLLRRATRRSFPQAIGLASTWSPR